MLEPGGDSVRESWGDGGLEMGREGVHGACAAGTY